MAIPTEDAAYRSDPDAESAPRDVSAPGAESWLIERLDAGDRSVLGELLALLYDDLRALARRRLRGAGQTTLQPTALVNEACVRLLAARSLTLRSRAHLRAVAATAMKQVLVDRARRRQALRRGGGAQPLAIEGMTIVSTTNDPASTDGDGCEVDVLALSDALERLGRIHARKARVVELRFFGGLSIEEAAAALDVSRSTVASDWTFARAWIVDELRAQGAA